MKPGRPWAALLPALLAALLAAGCGGPGAGAGAPSRGAADAPAARPGWVDAGPGIALDSLLRRAEGLVGRSRRSARARRGEPGDVARRTVPNRHVKGAVDTVVTLSWEGARARYLISGANGRELLASVRVDGGRALERLLPAPLRGREGMRAILDEPARVDGDRWLYVCCPGRRGAEETLAVRLRDGGVVAVEAGFYVD